MVHLGPHILHYGLMGMCMYVFKLENLPIKRATASERKRLQLLSSEEAYTALAAGAAGPGLGDFAGPQPDNSLLWELVFFNGSPAMFTWCWPPLGSCVFLG